MSSVTCVGRKIGQGNSAEVFDCGAHILKLYFEETLETECETEFVNTHIAQKIIKRVPQPIEITSVDGRKGAVYEKMRGKTMLRRMVMMPWRSGYYGRRLAEYHFNIHRSVSESLPAVKDKLKNDIQNVSVLAEHEKSLLCRYLNTLPDGSTFCHFDIHPDNIMLFQREHSVLDWTTACIGDRHSDVARTAVIMRFTQIPRAPALVNFFAAPFIRHAGRAYVRRYLKLTKSGLADVTKWELPVAAARLSEPVHKNEHKRLLKFVRKELAKLSKNEEMY